MVNDCHCFGVVVVVGYGLAVVVVDFACMSLVCPLAVVVGEVACQSRASQNLLALLNSFWLLNSGQLLAYEFVVGCRVRSCCLIL